MFGFLNQTIAQEQTTWVLLPSPLSPVDFSDSIVKQIVHAEKLGVQHLEILVNGELQLAAMTIKPFGSLKSLRFSGLNNAKLIFHETNHQTAFIECQGFTDLLFEDLAITTKAVKTDFFRISSVDRLVFSKVNIANTTLGNEVQLFDFECIEKFFCKQSNFKNLYDLGEVKEVGALEIKGCQWEDFSQGLQIANAHNLVFDGNLMLSKSGFGVHCTAIENGSFKRNRINTHQTAINVSGVESQGSLTVINNMFSSSSLSAVLFTGLSELQYYHNSSRGVYGFTANQIQNASIINNIFFGSQSLSFRLFQMPQSLMLNYNLYFSHGPNLSRIADNVWSELNGWQASLPQFNQNSLEGNPLFYSATDLHVMGLLPKNNGANGLGIFVDFDGDLRPIPANAPVDIGADEYELPVIDGMLESIFVKSALCSDSTFQLGLVVTNLGTVPLGPTISVQLGLMGAITDSSRFSTNLILLPGVTDTLFFPIPSNRIGGTLSASAELVIVGDQRTFNNRLAQQALELMPLSPVAPDSIVVCSTAVYAEVYAVKNRISPHIWFGSASASVPLALGDTLHVAINNGAPNQNYFVNVLQESASLRTTFSGINQVERARFTLMAKQNLVINGFQFSPSATGQVQLNISVNHTGQNQWDTIFSQTLSTTYDQIFKVNIDALLLIPAGEDLNFSIDLGPGSTIKLLGLPSAVQNFENAHLRLDGASIIEQGSNGASLLGFVNSSVNYLVESCVQNRKLVALKTQTDVAQARMAVTQDSAGYVRFDAAGSFGHQFIWNFGDGVMGYCSPIWHRYLAKGDYLVKLIVIDTICQTTDTLYQTIPAHGSLELQNFSPLAKTPFPNPTSGLIEVHYPKGSKISLVQVGGVVLKEEEIPFDGPMIFDLSAYSKGFYFFKVSHPEWGTMHHRVVLK